MKNYIRILFLLFLMGGQVVACSTPRATSPAATQPVGTLSATNEEAGQISTPLIAPGLTPLPDDRLEAGKVVADLFTRQDFADVAAYFDETMKKGFTVSQMQAAWDSLASYGAFQSLGTPRGEKVEQYDVVFVPMLFEKGSLDLKVVFDTQGRIAGMFFTPSQGSATPAYTPPAYVNSQSFSEQDVTIGSGEWALPGTLTLPQGSGPFPAVVLVHGSGPNDRDETIGPNKPFRDLAWGLASQGIAVLRYDKRTYAHAPLFTPDILQTLTVNEETVDDALLAIDLLRHTAAIDPQRVYVLGHSLGGMMLPRIAAADTAQGVPPIAGLISLAGAVRPLEDLILEQSTYLAERDGTVSDSEQQNIQALGTQVAGVKAPDLADSTPAEGLPLGIPAHYWLDLRDYNPAATAQGLNIPMLILQGGRDYQVTVKDFDLWKAALGTRSDVQFHWYEDLNHLFIAGEGPANPDEYEKPGNVAEQVITDIAAWIQGATQ